MKLLCQGQSEAWNVNRKAQLFPSKPGSCANKVFGTSRIAFNHISPAIETRCDDRHLFRNTAAINRRRQTATLPIQKPDQRISNAWGTARSGRGSRSGSNPKAASTEASYAEGTDDGYSRKSVTWRPRCRRILRLRRRRHMAQFLKQSRRPVALRPHLSVGLPKNRGQYA